MATQGIPTWDGVWQRSNSSYDVFVKYQDGTDHAGNFKDLEAAKTAWRDGHKAWNHTDRPVSECPVYVPSIADAWTRIQ